MRIFDKLTGGGVEWQIELDSPTGAFDPGDEVSGRARYLPKGNMEVRAIRLALVCAEQYVYLVRERRGSVRTSSRRGRSEWERRWFSEELFRQDIEAAGTVKLVAEQPGEIPFRFQLPEDAPPSLDTQVLRLRWQVRAWMDVGGVDPSTERDISVALHASRLQAADAALAPSVSDGPAALAVESLPIVAGQPFRGYVEIAEQLDPRSVRVEIKQRAETHGGGGHGVSIDLNDATLSLSGGRRAVSDERVLWTGPLSVAGAGQAGQRYEFSGQLPAGPVPTIDLPHGSSTASIDVVISRRLMPDRHLTRPIAIVTG